MGLQLAVGSFRFAVHDFRPGRLDGRATEESPPLHGGNFALTRDVAGPQTANGQLQTANPQRATANLCAREFDAKVRVTRKEVL